MVDYAMITLTFVYKYQFGLNLGTSIRVEINMSLKRTLKNFCRHGISNPGTSYPGHGTLPFYIDIKPRQRLNNNEMWIDIITVLFFKQWELRREDP